MPLSKEHKAVTRERIVRSAGRRFRRVGFAGAAVADVMADAGLTHGGFYAHFRSKEELFAAVVATDHGLVRRLAERTPGTPRRWARRTATVLRDYLDPAHLEVVRDGCTLAALSGDVSRTRGAIRAGYQRGFEQVVGELLREPDESAAAALARASVAQRRRAAHLAATAAGAVLMASALDPGALRDGVLAGALATVRRHLTTLWRRRRS